MSGFGGLVRFGSSKSDPHQSPCYQGLEQLKPETGQNHRRFGGVEPGTLFLAFLGRGPEMDRAVFGGDSLGGKGRLRGHSRRLHASLMGPVRSPRSWGEDATRPGRLAGIPGPRPARTACPIVYMRTRPKERRRPGRTRPARGGLKVRQAAAAWRRLRARDRAARVMRS